MLPIIIGNAPVLVGNVTLPVIMLGIADGKCRGREEGDDQDKGAAGGGEEDIPEYQNKTPGAGW